MIAILDSVRGMLDDLGGGLGVTDPVSGEVVVKLAAAKPAKKAAKKRGASAAKKRAKTKSKAKKRSTKKR